MIKLNRTTEYGLIALRHMSRKKDGVTSAREVADVYGLPFEITAKTLQRLKDTGLIQSAQGAHGGYSLGKDLKEVSLSEFLRLMEGPKAVVLCANNPAKGGCEYAPKCEIKHMMGHLNQRINHFLSEIYLDEVAKSAVEPMKDDIKGEDHAEVSSVL